MATTIPALTSVDDILDTDLVMVTHSNGQSYKIPGTALNKRNQVVISANTTLTGTPLKTGNVVRAYFTADLAANNSSTPLTLSYNSVSYTVKVPKNGALANYLPFDVGGGVYKYLQAYTTLELIFDGTYFVVLGNPVVLSSADYTIYPDGNGRTNVVAANNLNSVTSNAVAAYTASVKYKAADGWTSQWGSLAIDLSDATYKIILGVNITNNNDFLYQTSKYNDTYYITVMDSAGNPLREAYITYTVCYV